MVTPARSVQIFDARNQPQYMGPSLKTLPFGGCKWGAPMERVIEILSMGKECLGHLIARVWNRWDSASLQQNTAMRNPHLEGWSSSGIPN
jgi:hypothetical protein